MPNNFEITLPRQYDFSDVEEEKVNGKSIRRPTKFTKARINAVIKGLLRGMSLQMASGLASVHPETVTNWLRKGAAIEDPSNTIERDLKEFYEACVAAAASNQYWLLDKVHEGASEDPELALKLLKTVHAEFADKTQHVHTHNSASIVNVQNNFELEEGKKEIDLASLSDEELELLEKIQQKQLTSGKEDDVVEAEVIDDK